MNKNFFIYDIEVFSHDWIVIFHSLETGEKTVFHNDNFALADFIDGLNTPAVGGYNSKNYDQGILKAIYHGASNSTVKELNDFIIAGNDWWNYSWLSHKSAPWINFDLMDDLGTQVHLRLKEIEGNLGMSIEESSVSFDIGRPLTEDELEEVVKYCAHDVDATVRLFEERKDYLESKVTLGAMKGLSATESLRLTNAKLTGAYLDARFYDRGDERIYDFPDNLELEKYEEVRKFFSRIDPTYKSQLEIMIADVPHTVAWGGLHGARPCYAETRSERRKVVHIDVTSYYPSLMIVNGYLSRSAPDPDEYRLVYEKRLAAKKSGDKATADALKLVLNTTYGAMKNPYNALYDPRMANAVCISGQLYLIDLIEKLETIDTFLLIQSNTDGLIVSYDADVEPEVKAAVAAWEARTGFKMGFDEVEKIIQKDVNNYVLRDLKGKIDVKGAYVSNYDGGDFKNKSLVVVSKAVVAALLDEVPVQKTIEDCAEPWQFQMIAKAGSSYDKVVWLWAQAEKPVQTVNRVYASHRELHGTIYKVKLEKEGSKARRDKIANLPDHCFIDNRNEAGIEAIDKSFYVALAQKRVNDYLGIVLEKKTRRKKGMATKVKNEETAAGSVSPVSEKKTLYQKLFELQGIMDAFEWKKDGKNRHQSYEYITEKQYKSNFKQARAAVGLLWKMEEIGHEFIGAVSDKMHLILTQFRGRLIDPDTGEFEEYLFSGSGADNGDKALYKAYTGGLKFFLATNYLVAEDNDPEGDEAEIRDEKPRYTSPERREDIKGKITDQNEPATEEQIEAIALGIEMLEAEGTDTSSFTELLGTELTKAEAEQLLEAIGELIPESA
ncbi:MAG: DNA polymerase elongation subunit (family B) [Bacillota bacterium]